MVQHINNFPSSKPLTWLLMSLVSLFIFSNCENEGRYVYPNIPVVVAYLQPGKAVSQFNVSLPIGLNDTLSGQQGLDDLVIEMSNSDTAFYLQSIGHGDYVSDHVIVYNAYYAFKFSYGGKEISSSTLTDVKVSGLSISATTIRMQQNAMPGLGGTSDEITVSWNNPLNKYCNVVCKNMESDPSPIMDFMQDAPTSISTEPIIDNTLTLNSRRSFMYLGKYYVYVYMISDDYANMFENISNRSSDLTEPYTNIVNGRGIFAAYHVGVKAIRVSTY